MTQAVISLLRGVNVGGHNKIKMDALRALYSSLGLGQAQTYVQSGNIVYTTAERNLVALGSRIENAIESGFGFRPAVIQRTAAELREVIRANPFPSQAENEPGKLVVMFLPGHPGAEARDKVLALKIHPEQLAFGAREIYIYFPQGMGQSKLPNAAIDRALRVPFTGRNWNSVTALLAMAEQLEAGLAK